MGDSIELPILNHLSHVQPRRSGDRSPSIRIPDVVTTSATMGGASTANGGLEAQEDPETTSVISREAGEQDPLLLRDKIVSEGELSEIRK